MADTITLPGFGPTKKSTAVAIGAGLVLVAGIAWYRSRNAAPAPAATDTTSAADTGSADTTGFDPSAIAGTAGYGDYGTGYGYGGSYGGYGSPTPAAYTTNAQWSQAVEDYLVNTVGEDANTVGNALGKYITGQPLTSEQVAIVEQGIAFANYPPVNGPTGYPPSFKTQSTPTPPPGGPSTNIPNASFVKVTTATTWANMARAYNVFSGNGAALYQYNLLPGKHQAADYPKVERTGGGAIPKNPGFQVAIPVRGRQITLPGVGTVTS